MKKLWVSLLAMLLTFALLIGAWAEGLEIELTEGEEEWEEYVPEEEVTEVEEFELLTEEGEEESEIAAQPIEDDEETAIAAPEYEPKSASSDFEIENGVLVGYHGAGGNVTIPNSVTSIGESAFSQCYNLTNVTIPNSVTSIGDRAFRLCDRLTSVTIPNSVTSIGEDAFDNCTSLANVTISERVTTIGDGAFSICESLTSIIIPNSVTSIGVMAFSGSGLTSIVIPDSVSSIGSYAFWNCKSLNSISFLKGIYTINEYAFSDCTSLSNVDVKGIVLYVGGGAFQGCSSLKSINIPDRFFYIGEYVFAGCRNLESVTVGVPLPPEVFYGKGVGESVFLGTFSPDEWKDAFTSAADWIIMDIDFRNKFPGYPIGDNAFNNCSSRLTLYTKCETTPTKRLKEMGYRVVASKHVPVIDPAVPATQTATGKTEGSHCSVCGTILVKQQTTPALGYWLSKAKSNDIITLNLGNSRQIIPSFATSQGLSVTSYKSSKAKVASVDGSGIVTAKAEGKATITVTTNNKKKKATVVIKVVDPYKPTGISITNGKKVTLEMGKTLKLGAQLKPDTAQSNLTWKSSKKSVATVDGSGLVTPHKEGTAKITVTTRNKKKATITVKVVDPTKPTGISITNGKTVTLKAGQTLKLGTALKPTTAQSELTWKSANKKIATVDATGTVKALKKGKVKITVTTKKNKKKATITVKVVP